MRIFVTGASGFVGSRLCRHLEEAGHTPLADDDLDVTRPSTVDAALETARPDAIVHLAALSSVADSFGDATAFLRVNMLGTGNLLDSARRLAPTARVLLVSSGEVYGPGRSDSPPFRETDSLRPRSPYARSKASAERLGALAAARGLGVIRVRPFNHTGAGQTDHFVASSFAKQIVEVAAGRCPARLEVGNLASVRDFLDVDDVLDAYVQLLERPLDSATYNIASGCGVTIQELLDTLIELANVEVEVAIDPARMRPTDFAVGSAERLRKMTGWEPKIPLSETLGALLEYWKGQLHEPSVERAR